MTTEEIHQTLKEFSEKYKLKQEAIDSCMKAMEHCIADDSDGLGGFSIDEIRLEFMQHDLIFEHYLYNIIFVKTKIGLYQNKENPDYVKRLKPIGYYELDTNMEGDSFDDWLIIDVKKGK
ncbi:MAG: hypothetical protein JNL70_18805 [Saprospiraceae bacterium]|nr:hypothetical protein [Saprospiraceae bacterium]